MVISKVNIVKRQSFIAFCLRVEEKANAIIMAHPAEPWIMKHSVLRQKTWIQPQFHHFKLCNLENVLAEP